MARRKGKSAEEKLKSLLAFLEKNKKYNRKVQMIILNEFLLNHKRGHHKVVGLMHYVINTQSRPNLDNTAEFWEQLNEEEVSLSSFDKFRKYLNVDSSTRYPFLKIHQSLKTKPTWGPKTSALFVKLMYRIHQGDLKNYRFWKDVPLICNEDRFFLPVDKVIQRVFEEILKGKKLSFASINKFLMNIGLTNKQVILLDDLWFWGFITQNVRSDKMEFNKAKLFALFKGPVKKNEITDIERLAKKFIEKLN